MHRSPRSTCRLLLIGVATTLLASAAPALGADTQAGKPRPRIGLVLSGGGARGYAHLGVLQVLEQNHIPVDVIAATSMGAVIGGLYASGQDVDTVVKRLSKLDLAGVAYDREARAELSQTLREDEFDYPIGISAGFGDGKIKLPTGFVQGNRFLRLLQDWTAELPSNANFDQLPIPFRAIATNLEDGAKVELRRGSLPLAIRASMAAPGLFAPTKIGNETLVDGGLVSNLPVHTALDMGADVVVAVDIGNPLRKIADINTPLAVTQQMLGILIGQNVDAERKIAKAPPNVLIEPDLGGIGFSDFSQPERAIAAGRAAAEAMLPVLSKLAIDPQAYAELRSAQLARVASQRPRIDKIDIVTSGRVSKAFVNRFVTIHEGEAFDPEKVKENVQAIANAGYFESVTYEWIESADGNRLVIDATEAAWGPHLFFFGLSLSSNFDGDGAFRFSIGHRYPWINASGLEWRNDMIFGSDIVRYRTELRQPLPLAGNYYVAPYAEFKRQNHDIFLNDFFVNQPANTLPFARYQLQTLRAGLDLGIPLKSIGELRLGVTYLDSVDRPKSFFPNDFVVGGEGTDNFFPVAKSRLFGPRVRLVLDQLDDVLFPRAGYYFLAENETSLLGGGNQYSESHVRGLWAATMGRHTLNAALEAGGDFNIGEKAQPPGFFLGGFQHLSAYAPDQFAGNFVLYGRLTYLTPLVAFDTPPFRTLFLGLSAEAGNVWVKENQFGQGAYRQSYSAFAGLTSSLGPLYLGFAYAPGGVTNVYFQLGRPF